MIKIIHAIILGLVQGLTEFLPVSSSAHLNIMPWLFNWEKMSESFDFALHFGTLLAILIYFFSDWISLISGGVKAVTKKEQSTDGRIFWFLVVATIPAGLVGALFEKLVDGIIDGNLNAEMILISIALIVMGFILYFVDKNCKSKITYEKMNFKQSFIIGISQALAAAVPGISRSGITMTVARANGLDRESAAKYSFLLSAPIVAGGMVVSLGKFELDAAFFAGILVSFVSGLLVIKFLMKYLKKGSYKGFAIYRVLLGVLILVIAITRL